ncbi:DNA-3-methyladenine glycosylase [Psychrobacillus sp. FJAT-51614]|uniref:DNA-3-methyladenine glycosylase II n=1 Tax=Psychrobacillus mangrovi TaxID=3117745 RepID=A0ABU8FBC2_9BACI
MYWNEQDEQIIIHTPPNFSFKQNLHYLSRSTNECLFHISEDMVRKAITVGECITLIEIKERDEHSLVVDFLGDTRPISSKDREKVAAYIFEWFDLKTDMSRFIELSSNDPILQQAITEFNGLRIMGIPDLFEAMVWGILGQQINLTYAYTLKRRLVEQYGRALEFEGKQYWVFPSPGEIANLSIEDLASLKMTVKKCEYLLDVANLINLGLLTKEMLLETNDIKKAEKKLTSIRGIGPWTANYVLMRCLRFPSAFPIDDVGLHNALKYITGSQQKPSKDEILLLSKAWKGWEAYATFYLWRFLY